MEIDVTGNWHRLARARLCTGLTSSDLRVIQQTAQRWHLKAGEVLCREGEPARGLYIVLDGLLRRGKFDEHSADVDWLGLSTQFGEHSLLTNHKESATVSAMLDSHGIVLGQVEFRRLLVHIPKLAVNLCRAWPK